MSLHQPHHLLLAAGQNSYEVSKARIQLKFLCSQYPCGERSRHWTPDNPRGLCTNQACYTEGMVETLEHVLLNCQAYSDTRLKLETVSLKLSDPISHRLVITHLYLSPSSVQMQLLLDCSVIPDVISARQKYGQIIFDNLFYLGRTWCFSIHRERLKRLGQWQFA